MKWYNEIKKRYLPEIVIALITIVLASVIIPMAFEWYHNHNEQKIVFNHLKFEIDRNLEIINSLEKSQEDMANGPSFTPLRLRYDYLERSLDFFNNETTWHNVSNTLYSLKTANSFMDIIRDMNTNDYASYLHLKKQNINTLINNLQTLKSSLIEIKSKIKTS